MGGKGSGTPRAALLKLDGTQIDKHGNEAETDFFSFLNLPAEHNANLEKVLTPKQALKFRNHIVRMRVGTSAAIPMLCGGARCPVKQCPFNDEKNWPLAEQCPIESSLVINWMKSYVEDLGVNPESRTEMVLVNKLIECDIIDYRANIGFSVDEDAWKLTVVDITTTAKSVIENTSAHPLIDIKEKTHRIRQTVLESLAATRKEKYKRAQALKQRNEESIGDHFAKLKIALGAVGTKSTGPSIDRIKEDTEKLADDNNDIVDTDWETPDST